ncbi:MAG: DUF5677 domain-containing protein [Thermoplasmatota archaeon]
MGRSRKKKRKKNRYTPISDHKRIKKELIPPMKRMPITQVDFERNQIPEFLWIESLKNYHNSPSWHIHYDFFIDVIEQYIDSDERIFLGLISDFNSINPEKREKFITEQKDIIVKHFLNPFGRILLLYPDCPAKWLLLDEWVKELEIENEEQIEMISHSLMRLYDAKEHYTANIRIIPLKRLFKHGKIRLPSQADIIDLLPKYPDKLDDDKQYYVESFGRNIINMYFGEHYQDNSWSKYFWNRNFEFSKCKFEEIPEEVYDEDIRKRFDEYYNNCVENTKVMDEYFNEVIEQYVIDIYDPSKDEVILGLFSRIIRLYKIINLSPDLWAIDISRILLRCISDTLITYCYLIMKNENELYSNFIEYGKGKEKLLLLHLQDTHPSGDTPLGEKIETLAASLGGGMSPEFINVNIGDWIDKSIRTMAQETDLMEIYRLIYDPTSSDIHGTWTSVKNVNLTYCYNPLHRFHRLPQVNPPPLFLNPTIIASKLILVAIQRSQEILSFPKLAKEINIPKME